MLAKSCIKISRSIQFATASENINSIVEENVSSTVPPTAETTTAEGVAVTPEDEKGIFENIGKLMLIYSRIFFNVQKPLTVGVCLHATFLDHVCYYHHINSFLLIVIEITERKWVHHPFYPLFTPRPLA